jgi:hypothetical protein
MAPKFHFKIMDHMVMGFAALYPSYASLPQMKKRLALAAQLFHIEIYMKSLYAER